jgi:HAD superfamily hydrolase (TIGR01662 family)
MIKAVLLDMDETLYTIDTDEFVRQYIDRVVAYSAEAFPAVSREALNEGVRASVRAIVDVIDPTATNADRALMAFSRRTGIEAEAWLEAQTAFHAGAYHELRVLASQNAAARPLVQRLLDMGLAVVVATNPIFTEQAIMTRLAWAGLADINVALVTHSGNMHFAKPQPHYYEEILARVGVEPDETIMVGDHAQMDMHGAHRAGLNTFWVESGNGGEPPAAIDGRGTLADFAARVADRWLGTLAPVPRTAAQVKPRMIGNIGAIYGLVDTIKPNYWHMRPDPEEWSPLEILVHLRDSERNVQRSRLQRIATEDNPFISPPRTPPGPGGIDLTDEVGQVALRQLWEERCTTVTYLDGLHDEQWSRPARHSIFGPTSLLEMAHFTTRHDHLHITQLCQTVGRCAQQ